MSGVTVRELLLTRIAPIGGPWGRFWDCISMFVFSVAEESFAGEVSFQEPGFD